MSDAREILVNIIDNFSADSFNHFFRKVKNSKYNSINQSYSHYDDDSFKKTIMLGDMTLQDDRVAVFAIEVLKDLTERSGKKAQYDKAKKILRDDISISAGIFIFYDSHGCFRFSLIYKEYLGTKSTYSNFKRFTYYVNKELTNKTFLQRIGEADFSSLDKIKEAFSVEKVTKQFYQDIANWYFWAVDNSQFPKDAESEKNGRKISIIRLITRMIFIWFMRERNLIPNELFNKDKVSEILTDLSDDESTYYKAILQNLFFATLSTKKDKRNFASEVRWHNGYNPDFDNQYVFRYQELFNNPDDIKKYCYDIPFLNGGLFECLDDKKNGIYIDGFSRTKSNQPNVPNFLFFSSEQEYNKLNTEYGTSNKKYIVRGLIDTLSQFNFTIDENSPDDADVALDPELLGRVFENLLASFNPETSDTARKATGSYYTPREIVDYMVSESLKAYFKTHLKNIEDIDDILEKLFSAEDESNPFNEYHTKTVVDLIENVKIVDPAVGSGAFPMGMLNRLVFILNKIDPGNELWKQAQIKAANKIIDSSIKRATLENIEKYFNTKNADYGRKLYLIQRCIYGVDIQHIAVEIAKLRFFISLLVNETVDSSLDNFGIEPLPNMDFKIMQGNSLIEHLSGKMHDKDGQFSRIQMVSSLNKMKDELFETTDPIEKKEIRNNINRLIKQIFEHDRNHEIEQLRQRIKAIKDQQRLFEDRDADKKDRETIKQYEEKIKQLEEIEELKPEDHFEWHINFSEVFDKGGFDIVIGNPPYIQLQKTFEGNIKYADLYKNCNYKTFDRMGDIYCLFYEKGNQING
ncbi:MAG: hypothetical protein SNJ70_10030 [Armatimonadota bacterium]